MSTRDSCRKVDSEDAWSLDMLEKGFSKCMVASASARPGSRNVLWNRCCLLSEPSKFRMFDELSGKLLFSARLHDKDFYISQYLDFPDTFDVDIEVEEAKRSEDEPRSSNTGSKKTEAFVSIPVGQKRFCSILRNNGDGNGYKLYSRHCRLCDDVLKKFDCGLCDAKHHSDDRQLLGVVKQEIIVEPLAGIPCRSIDFKIPLVVGEDESIVWCPRTNMGQRLPRISSWVRDQSDSEEEQKEGSLQDDMQETETVLKTRMPRYSTEMGSLVMSFEANRVSAASSKNFLIVNDNDKPVFQCGKADTGKYNVDFSHPLSAHQAFALALSSFVFNARDP